MVEDRSYITGHALESEERVGRGERLSRLQTDASEGHSIQPVCVCAGKSRGEKERRSPQCIT